MKKKALLIDDTESFLEAFSHLLGNDYHIITANTIKSGLKKIEENPNVILLDMEFAGKTDGLTALPKIKEIDPNLPVIMLTKHNEPGIIVKAMQLGASDYFVKSPKINDLKIIISRAIEKHSLQDRLSHLQNLVDSEKGTLIGSSPAMQRVHEEICQAAKLDIPVLILGETGTGKELVAREIHRISSRNRNPFTAVNVSAINNDLFASELFGHEKGAFTGAMQRKKGLLEITEEGTILLDEIGYLPLESQVKLLRVIEDKTFRRVGGTQETQFSARILASTNQDLHEMMKKREFRDDLFFRISGFQITIPPLRDRTEDIPVLVEYFLKLNGKAFDFIDSEAIDALIDYDWPGNVRQLKSLIEIAAVTVTEKSISNEHVNMYLLGRNNVSQDNDLTFGHDLLNKDYKESKDEILTKFQHSYINALLKKTNHNIAEASKQSGLSRNAIYEILKSNPDI